MVNKIKRFLFDFKEILDFVPGRKVIPEVYVYVVFFFTMVFLLSFKDAFEQSVALGINFLFYLIPIIGISFAALFYNRFTYIVLLAFYNLIVFFVFQNIKVTEFYVSFSVALLLTFVFTEFFHRISLRSYSISSSKIYSAEILKGVALISSLLLRTNNWQNEIVNVMKIIVEKTQMDAVTLFQNRVDEETKSFTAERKFFYVNKKNEHRFSNRKDVFDFEGLASNKKQIESSMKGEIIFSSVRYLSPEEQTLFKSQGTKFFMVIPLFLKKQWWGEFYLESFEDKLIFENFEKENFQILGEILSEAIESSENSLAMRVQSIKLNQYFKAIENASEHIVITDKEGIVIYANKAVEQITGFSSQEIIGQKAGGKNLWGGHMPKELYAEFWDTIKNKKQTFKGEIKNRRKNGDFYFAGVTVTPVLDESGKVVSFIEIERDVTEEKKYKENLAQLAAIFKFSNEPIIILDKDCKISNWNNGASKIYGYTANEAIGSPVSLIIPNEKLQKEFDEIFERTKKGDYIETYKTLRKKKSGEVINVLLSISPIYDSKNEFSGITSIAYDITKDVEIDKAKSEFVSLASHQLRTPLSVIKWYVELLESEKENELSSTQKEYVQEVKISTEHMVSLVKALLNVSRIELGTFIVNPKLCNLDNTAKKIIKLIKKSFSTKNIELSYFSEGNLGALNFDEDLFGILIQNLVSNSVKYTPECGKVKVTIVNKDGKVTLSVQDTGYGIPESEKPKIFEKLYRGSNIKTKVTEGTGLGLYIVKSIVEKSGGKIWFESKENEGTTFFVEYPESGMIRKEGTKSIDYDVGE